VELTDWLHGTPLGCGRWQHEGHVANFTREAAAANANSTIHARPCNGNALKLLAASTLSVTR